MHSAQFRRGPLAVLAREIREKAQSLGFGDVGFTGIAPFTRWADEMKRRLDTEETMRPVWARYRIASDPSALMSGVKTIAVLAWPYQPYSGEWPKGCLRWSAYYECWDPAREALSALIGWLQERGVMATAAHDHVPLKEAAERAGLGRIGINQLLITPRWGSCVYLDAILIDRKIDEEQGPQGSLPCDQCQRCVAVCPMNALESDGTFHREKCLRHYMLSGDIIPEAIRGHLGNNLVGCETCQMVCPQNHGQYKGERAPDPDTVSAFFIADILEEWTTGLKGRMKRMAPVIGVNYARARKVLSAALIASREEWDLTSAIGRALMHSHPHIRRYAAWALSYHEGDEAERLLYNALAVEEDGEVREEILAALNHRIPAGKDFGITDSIE